ncbi:uncharacterized protein LOC125672362 [Ostrea edulis]|uniref:uncharacterized protein LOC125672362 n=1 Tax=Ostrea edulis TaxID=37623 RepID=UPI0024AF6332|nr:uncharacterized protein LOC125672362 [Ostrea edulis]
MYRGTMELKYLIFFIFLISLVDNSGSRICCSKVGICRNCRFPFVKLPRLPRNLFRLPASVFKRRNKGCRTLQQCLLMQHHLNRLKLKLLQQRKAVRSTQHLLKPATVKPVQPMEPIHITKLLGATPDQMPHGR